MTFGDVEWARRGGGRLGWDERLGQIWEVVRFQLRERLRKRPRTVGASSPAELDRMMKEIELPKTELVGRAAALVTELGPDALAGHALRTFAWGTLLGLRDGLTWDRERFALAALLHDLALARRRDEIACFAADGAQQAMSALEEWGAREGERRAVGDAVCLHVRVAVPPSLGVEAHLVQRGAGVDVVGLGVRDLDPALVERVLARHPRGALKSFLVDAFTRDAARHPGTRMALWVSHGFLDRIRKAPFEG